jgi:hypothetical protein
MNRTDVDRKNSTIIFRIISDHTGRYIHTIPLGVLAITRGLLELAIDRTNAELARRDTAAKLPTLKIVT